MLKKFEVRIARTISQYYIIKVEAENDLKAGELALDQAGDFDFNEGSTGEAEYAVDDCNEVE